MPVKLLFRKNIYVKDSDIANVFNTFFTNIGNTVEEKIPIVKTHFSSYLKNNPPNSIFLKPTSEAEVVLMINDITVSKACGPFSLPSNLLKHFSELFSKPLTLLINKSFSEGNFPNLLKLA